ncbi:hypothetical protein ACFWBB_42075 [Streptomyces sp. NPDC060000]|uniref:hypothetical protein n=1 Tax=Streptomyces sp. NPDC060000 TaxID=3347031 RepID=UPI00367DA9B8
MVRVLDLRQREGRRARQRGADQQRVDRLRGTARLMSRLVHLGAEEILRGLLGDADRVAVLDRLTAAAAERVARYRRFSAIVNGVGTQPSYDAEYSWVVAALRAHQGR